MLDGLDSIINEIITIYNIFFVLAIVALVQIQRKIAEWVLDKINDLLHYRWPEKSWPVLVKSRFWTELMVPLGPLGTGMILVWILPNYPYPEMFSAGANKLVFGLGLGLISGFVWRIIKKSLGEQIKNLTDKLRSSDSSTNDSTS